MVIEARLGTNTIIPLAAGTCYCLLLVEFIPFVHMHAGVFASWKEDDNSVGDETEENNGFMWEQFKATGLNEWLSRKSGSLTVITDRGKEILAGVRRAMPDADVIFCCFHLLCNINKHCKGTLTCFD